MVNGAFNLSTDAADLAFQRGDAGMKLGHRQPIQVLPDQQGERVVGARGGVVELHGGNVDRGPRDVNNGPCLAVGGQGRSR